MCFIQLVLFFGHDFEDVPEHFKANINSPITEIYVSYDLLCFPNHSHILCPWRVEKRRFIQITAIKSALYLYHHDQYEVDR